MDPYIERPILWPDFHDSLITRIGAALQPLLKPRYVALTQDRLHVVKYERHINPDVSVALDADALVVFDLQEEEIRQPLLHIIETAPGNRLVTAIEVLSPDNKAAGEGRTSYLQKRDELWRGGANLVEIDLLRAGQPTLRIPLARLEPLRPWHYLVTVTRRQPPRQETHAVPLTSRLPRVGVPLTAGEADVTLDLQAVFTRCWDEGPYPELLHYEGPPPGTLSQEEQVWCEKRLRVAGYRPEAVQT